MATHERNRTNQPAGILERDEHLHSNRQIEIKESKMKINTATLYRLAGISALVAGLCAVIVGVFHPVNVPSAVTSAVWVNVHIAAIAMSFFGLFGMAGLYARQAEKAGWLGLAGFVLYSLWFGLVIMFSFMEAFILPQLAASFPAYVESIMAMFGSAATEVDLGILPGLWDISGPMFIVGPLLFGIATFRAGILPRWAGALLTIGAVFVPVGGLVLSPELASLVMVPVGLALAWLGYALMMERAEKTSQAALHQSIFPPEPRKVA